MKIMSLRNAGDSVLNISVFTKAPAYLSDIIFISGKHSSSEIQDCFYIYTDRMLKPIT